MAITAAKLLIYLGADTAEAEKGLLGVSNKLNSFSQKTAAVGKQLSLYVTAPLVGVGTAAVKMATTFDENMNVLQKVSGATAEEMEQLRETARALGADMTIPGTSAADAAEAMLELSKAGLSVDETLAAAKGTLQLAAAGQLSNAAAAEIAANALNAFGLEGERATDVADLLAAAANASSGEVTDMADSLKMAATVAATAGLPIEDVVAAISEMANAGIKGSDAGTSLKQMLLSLQAPSDKAKALMEDLGISIYDAQGNMVGMEEMIRIFSEALSGLTQEQRNAALATIFGSDAVRAANVVLMGGVDSFNAMRDAVTEEGAAAEIAGARMEGLAGAFAGLRNVAEDAMIAGVEPFKDDIIELTGTLADLVAQFSALEEPQQEAIVKFGLLVAGIGPAMLVLSGFAKAAGGVMTILSALPGMLSGITQGFAAWRSGMTLTTALGAAGLAPIAISLGAIAVSVGAGIAVWAQWNKQIVKTNQEGQKATASTWTKFFDDLSTSGADATQVAEEFVAAQERVQGVLDSTNPVVREFISNQEALSGSYDDASAAILAASGSYEEYQAALQRVAEANGLVVDSSGQLIQAGNKAAGTYGASVDRVLAKTYQLSEAQFEAVKAAQAFGGASNDVGVQVAILGAAAEGAAPQVDALNGELAEAAQTGMGVSTILDTLSGALTDAGWSADTTRSITEQLSQALSGTLSPAEQLEADVQLISEAFAAGGITAAGLTRWMQEAEKGTLTLSEAERAGYQAAIDHAAALREAKQAAQEATVEQLKLAQALTGASEAQVAQAAINGLTQALEDGTISLPDYVTAVSGVQDTFGLADEQSRLLAEGLGILNQALADGAVPASDYATTLGELMTAAADGKTAYDDWVLAIGGTPEAMTPANEAVDGLSQNMSDLSGEAETAVSETISAWTGGDWAGAGTTAATDLAQPIETYNWAGLGQSSASDISGAFRGENWSSVGTAITNGIAAGIRAGKSSVIRAAIDVAIAAIRAAQNGLNNTTGGSDTGQSQSQSQTMNASAMSWTQGILANASLPVQAMTVAAPAVIGAAQTTYMSVEVNAQLNRDLDLYVLAREVAEEIRRSRL